MGLLDKLRRSKGVDADARRVGIACDPRRNNLYEDALSDMSLSFEPLDDGTTMSDAISNWLANGADSIVIDDSVLDGREQEVYNWIASRSQCVTALVASRRAGDDAFLNALAGELDFHNICITRISQDPSADIAHLVTEVAGPWQTSMWRGQQQPVQQATPEQPQFQQQAAPMQPQFQQSSGFAAAQPQFQQSSGFAAAAQPAEPAPKPSGSSGSSFMPQRTNGSTGSTMPRQQVPSQQPAQQAAQAQPQQPAVQPSQGFQPTQQSAQPAQQTVQQPAVQAAAEPQQPQPAVQPAASDPQPAQEARSPFPTQREAASEDKPVPGGGNIHADSASEIKKGAGLAKEAETAEKPVPTARVPHNAASDAAEATEKKAEPAREPEKKPKQPKQQGKNEKKGSGMGIFGNDRKKDKKGAAKERTADESLLVEIDDSAFEPKAAPVPTAGPEPKKAASAAAGDGAQGAGNQQAEEAARRAAAQAGSQLARKDAMDYGLELMSQKKYNHNAANNRPERVTLLGAKPDKKESTDSMAHPERIIIGSTRVGAGCTFLAFTLALELAAAGRRPLVLLSDQAAVEETYAALPDTEMLYNGFLYKGCTVAAFGSEAAMRAVYDIEVADAGVIVDGSGCMLPAAHTMEADLKILCMSGAPWDLSKVKRMLESKDCQLSDWTIACYMMPSETQAAIESATQRCKGFWVIPNRRELFINFRPAPERYEAVIGRFDRRAGIVDAVVEDVAAVVEDIPSRQQPRKQRQGGQQKGAPQGQQQ